MNEQNAIFILGVIFLGWCLNVWQLIQRRKEPLNVATIFKILGVFIPPLGVIMGVCGLMPDPGNKPIDVNPLAPKQSGYVTIYMLAVIAIGILGVIGWIANIVQMYTMVQAVTSSVPYMLIFKAFGLFIPPLGALLGWLGIFM